MSVFAVAAAIVIAAGGIFYWQWSRPVPADALPRVEETAAAEPDNRVRRFSDGVLIDPSAQPDRWYAVMVENSAEAWPLSGLSQARLVIEAPVEGSIPRFMAMFDNKQVVEKIGPVRSARPYYIDWALGFHAMYVHVGGSPEALSKIDTLSARDLNQFFWDPYFWRSKDRYAPHNVYTSVELLNKGFDKRGYTDGTDLPALGWDYNDTVQTGGQEVKGTFMVSYSSLTHDYDASWVYEEEKVAYARWQNNASQRDQDDNRVYAANVVVLKMPVSVIDDVGRRHIATIGNGEGYLFRDGRRFEITWKKTGTDAALMLQNKDGLTAQLRSGTTWIEVIPLSTEIQYP